MKRLIFLFIVLLIAAGCSDKSTNPQDNATGQLKLYLVDSHTDLDSIVVSVSSVEIQKAGNDSTSGWVTLNDSLRYFDLLQLRNGANVVLGDTFLTAGQYTQIRLILADSNYVVDTNGVKYNLTIPSGSQTGLKLTHQFTIDPNTLYELLLDFDANRSIVKTGNGNYKLKPTIRVIAKVTSGSISGIVLPLDADPVVWTTVGSDTVSTIADSSGYFRLMALPAGTYNVSITPGNNQYADSTITGINVTAEQNTDLGTITLISQ